ncbi:MAG: dihydrolipoamide dehydrogenase [Alphaproteobacteria bacterium]|nr:dihydrolipoamide dehydrogenase [Alphaproteobacteria bacterium]
MAEVLNPDLCVIGAGSGGLSLAAQAAAFGVPVVLIEKGRMGGECLNTGCIPSKAMIAAAKRGEAFRTSQAFGIKPVRPAIEFDQVNDHVHAVIGAIAPNDSRERFTGLGVRVVEGEARFRDTRTVVVGQESDVKFEIKARRFVIATGSVPAIPPIPGLDGVPYLTNETVFELRERPKHLIVIGAGPVGMELAQAFRRLGSEVTVLDAGQPLAKEDPECAAVVLDAFAREGVTVRGDVKIARVRRVRSRIEVVLAGDTEETIQGTEVLVAAGRRPNVAGLDLDAGRIKHGPTGIAVNKRFGTSNKRVYAIGDVIGKAQFTHAANLQASLMARHLLFRLPVRMNADDIPRVTFTDPELAHVGLTDAQAREQYKQIRVLRWPYHENDRAQAERETRGHIKVITDKKGLILGATIVGAVAGEQITAWTLAINHGLNIRAFAEIVVPYPTFTEIGKRAAVGFFTPRLAGPWVRRVVNFFRRLG